MHRKGRTNLPLRSFFASERSERLPSLWGYGSYKLTERVLLRDLCLLRQADHLVVAHLGAVLAALRASAPLVATTSRVKRGTGLQCWRERQRCAMRLQASETGAAGAANMYCLLCATTFDRPEKTWYVGRVNPPLYPGKPEWV